MQITFNTKTIVAIGAVCLALTAIGAVASPTLTFVAGVTESGPLPVPSRREVNMEIADLTQQFQIIQRQAQIQAQQDAQRDRILAATRQQLLEGILFSTPKTGANQREICSLIDQIDQARAVNRLPPMPPCGR